MRKIYSSLLVLAMMMVSMVAKAQYTVTIDSDPIENWVAGQKSFAATEIATALGLADVDALEALVVNPNEEGNAQGGAVYLKVTDGKSNAYTGNVNEFWMNLDGVPQGYGDDGTSWFVGLEFEAAGSDEESGESWEDRVNVYVGQMPGVFKKIYVASSLKCTLYLVNGEKEVSFDVTQNVTAAPEPTVPEPTTSLNALEIVKDYTLTLPFVVGKSYEGKTYSTTLDGVYEALGTTADEFDANAADMTYTQVVKIDSLFNEAGEATGEVEFTWLDELKLPEEGAGGGWYGRYSTYDEASGEETVLPMNAPKTWGTGANTFYVQGVTLAEGEYSITSGQYPNVLKEGDEDFAYLYLIYGSKAARIKVVTEVTKPESVPFDQMTKAGEETVEITSKANTDYSTKSFTVDMEAVLAALGCEADDLDDFYAFAAEGELSDNHTTSGGGYYFTQEGFIGNWSDKAPVYIDPSSLAEGKYNIGQYAGIYSDITEDVVWTTTLILMYGDKYYAINVKYTVTAPKQEEEPVEYEMVASEYVSRQIVPASEYLYGTTTQLDFDYIATTLGTTDFVLYGEKYSDKEDYADTNGIYWSSSTNCSDGDEKGAGFWYGSTTHEDVEHQVVVTADGWSSSASFGFQLSESGVISWFQYPDARKVGDEYLAKIYFVNEETGAYIRYLLHVIYVEEEAPEMEVVMTSTETFEASDLNYDDDLGCYVVSVPTDEIYEALGLDDELLEAASFAAARSQTMFISVDPEEDVLFDAEGYAQDETSTKIASMAHIEIDGGLNIVFDPMELAFEEGDESKATARFAIDYDGKRAIIVVTLLSENSPLAVNGISTKSAKPAGIYSISGARLAAPQKGINILKMADGSVKKVLVK